VKALQRQINNPVSGLPKKMINKVNKKKQLIKNGCLEKVVQK
jgi:hypothetical protein